MSPLLRSLRVFVLGALFGATFFASQAARAQLGTTTINVPVAAISHSDPDKVDHPNIPLWLSYSDCRNDNGFKFRVNYSGAKPQYPLQVWIGGEGVDCTQQIERTSETADCWQPVPDQIFASNTLDYEISAQEIVAGYASPVNYVPDNATALSCDSEVGGTAGTKITFWFMVVNAGTVVGAPGKWTTTMDVRRPAPPTLKKAGIGENRLMLNFSGATATDRNGYVFFCEASGAGSATDGGTDGPGIIPLSSGAQRIVPFQVDEDGGVIDEDASAGSGGVAGTAGLGGTGGTAGTIGTDGAAGSGGVAGSSGTGGDIDGGEEIPTGPPPNNPKCPVSVLSTEFPPPNRYRCGSVSVADTDKGEASGLQNYQLYAVAVATVDTVGNVGPLSNLECGTPQIVTDFFEAYRDSGGKAGGGFCAIRQGGGSGVLLFVLGALVMRILRRRLAR